jgi:hypothetical protein
VATNFYRYWCCPSFRASTPQTPPTLGIHVSAVKQCGILKGQWHIIGSEFGEKKGTITGGTLDKTKYDLKGRESIDTLCSRKTPRTLQYQEIVVSVSK